MDALRAIPEVLARADAEATLPRLGGMARPDGVVIVSERFWAFAGLDGSVRTGDMPTPRESLQRIPLLRGLVRLVASLSPLFRRSGVARRRERYLLLLAVLAPLLLILAPEWSRTPVGIVLTVGLLGWMLRGRTLNLHGAEHRAIGAAEARCLGETWSGTARPSRFAPRCGTNFAALAAPVTIFAERLWPFAPALYTPLAVTLVALSLTMELWLAIQDSSRSLARGLLLPGMGLQRLTTREPRLAETRVALTALASVLERELA
ncbi:MAG: DUF1385 domain-containing protein [Actinomycetota bacterium]|nr:DUF1385 domain-containing protein [Actinomycetota bacterium]